MGKTAFTICAALILLFALAGDSHAAYSGGTGEPNSPFEIGTVADWQKLMESPSDWDKHFILTADLDVNGVALSPVGNDANNFTGVLDGNDHVIRSVEIIMPGENTWEECYVGLFGYVGPFGHIRNINIEDAEIAGFHYVGGVAGFNYGGNITGCHVTGSVVGGYYTGGLVGWNEGSIINCSAAASVSSRGGRYDRSFGGLVGRNYKGSIRNCFAAGSVSGVSSTGGLAGSNKEGNINACYATGSVSGDSGVGGLIGNGGQNVANCYAVGAVNGSSQVGALIGGGSPVVRACFWNLEICDCVGNAGGKGLTTAQMKSATIFSNAGWDGEDWVMEDGVDYPRLAWEGTDGAPIPAAEPISLSGSGTEEDPYQIWTAEDFALLSWYVSVLDKHIKLMADVDLAGAATYPIGDLGIFNGGFDGNGHIIRNANVNMPNNNYIGIFTYTGSNCIIVNVGIEHAIIRGNGGVGGLAGLNAGMIKKSYVTGSVRGGGSIGGLVGSNWGNITNCYTGASVQGESVVGGFVGGNGDGSISNCYSIGSVIGDSDVGGLVGLMWEGAISECYATGSVSADSRTGGLVGYNDDGIITNCYSTGSIDANEYTGGLIGANDGSIIACLWDIETSGQSISAGGHGLGTILMKSLTTYSNLGWTGNNWVIADGLDYPHLIWEVADGVPLTGPEPVPLLGSGTEEDPYQIWTADDFTLLNRHILVLDKHIRLMADVDLEGIALYPIGELSTFIGVFDGDNHVISNAAINMSGRDYVGLLGNVGSDGEIRNLGIEDANVVGRRYTGILAGRNEGTISNCYTSGSVSGENCVGGLAGYNDEGSITDCCALGPVKGADYVGGLLGYNRWPGTVSYCYATGSVQGEERIGGLVGQNYGGKVKYCYATGSVIGSESTGGLVGRSADEADIRCCRASGSVSGISAVGGLVGSSSDSDISKCYATGAISGESYVGGLAGSGGYIRDCYATGGVSGNSYVGGLVGSVGNIVNCYATGGTPVIIDGLYYFGGVAGYFSYHSTGHNYFLHPDYIEPLYPSPEIPLTDTQMRREESFVGWDFVGEEVNGTEDIWAICEGMNYPRLVWQIPEADWVCPDGVGFEDFGEFADLWGASEGGVYLDDEEGVGFGDLVVFCGQWLEGR